MTNSYIQLFAQLKNLAYVTTYIAPFIFIVRGGYLHYSGYGHDDPSIGEDLRCSGLSCFLIALGLIFVRNLMGF